MTVKGVPFQRTAPYCSRACGRLRRKSGRYCVECHREWQRRKRAEKKAAPPKISKPVESQQMTESQIFARAVVNIDLMLSRIAQGKHPLTGE